MASAPDFENWASIIRSCCLTSKTPLTMYEISRDVKMLEGTDIPYRSFNYRTLEDMVKDIPGLKVFNMGGKWVAQTVVTEETAHIVNLVQRAKPKKKRTMAPMAGINRYNYNMTRKTSVSKSGYNNAQTNRYNTQNKYVPNSRPTGHYSSQQSQSSTSSYNRSQQQNGEQFRRPTTSPVSTQAAAPRQPSTTAPPKTQQVHFVPTPSAPAAQPKPTSFSSTTPVQQRMPHAKLEQTPSQQQRLSLSPTDPSKNQQSQIRSPQQSTAPPMVQQPSLQQRLAAAPVFAQPPTSNIQERLNVQTPRATVQPMNDPRLILNSYVQGKDLPLPIYKDVPSKDKNIYSSVTVNSKKYSSYPHEAKTKDDAEKLAAQAALTELLDKSKIPRTITQNRAEIMKRVLEIVQSHPNGIFESCLLESYVARHNEGLPANWLKIVEHAINVDMVNSPVNNMTILSPQQAGNDQLRRPASPTLYEPPTLNVSNLDEFWFKVYVVYSSMDVWGIVISETNSDKINDLAIEMKHFYDINAATPTAVVPGQHYAVLDSENWHRVRCIKVDNDMRKATVFFIDRGDEDEFDLSDLRDLSVKFYGLPAQAIQISLDGLEPFYDCAEMRELLEATVLENDVWVIVDSASKQANVLTAHCYVQKDEKTIVDVNLELVREFMATVAEPKNFMKTNKAACEVYISEIRDKQIYVQVESTGLRLLNSILTDLANNYLDVKLVKPAARLEKSKLYLVKHENRWMRIGVLRESSDKALVECVDVGSIIEVPKDHLVAIEGISTTLGLIPRQATQVNLHKISPIMFDENMAGRLRCLAPRSEAFFMKVVGDREMIPRVELYKRTENNFLASLNDTLTLESEFSSKTDDNNNDDKKSRLRNDRKSLSARTEFPLKTPEIPPIGAYFDVTITMAAHPGNFTVQPLQTATQLKTLMSDLSAACNAYNGPPLTSGNVKVGSMYAAKYDNDGKWYRAYVSKLLGKSICAVYFCDYGDYRAVSLEQLQPLANQFYDLPYQAIKAKLHGITPKLKGDWTVKDSFRFNELVVDKPFVSMVKAYDTDNKAPGETILSLELIDTTTDDDVYIIQQLVDEKRADRIVEEQRIEA